MERASFLYSGYDASSDKSVVRVGGNCVITMEGAISL